MARVKIVTLFTIVLLIISTLTYATARPEPAAALTTNSLAKTESIDGEVMVDENCEGAGEEECLIRRTLIAHTDYIYTQKQNP